MEYDLCKITLSGQERNFKKTRIPGEYEIYFENCFSKINLCEFLADYKSSIEATTMWGSSGEKITDTFIVNELVESPNFPESKGFKTYSITWSSSTAIDYGYMILKLTNMA
ncbi:hypothetical protein [Photobacterium kishitanii]|uniref:Uncharacterized protein n=1 Tax=Photobacterium kishitanii TaxID=318456 RepID=A0AAX0YR25_9GAMM|nr:hypothetical protein [Photobacterium kishitanii]PSX42997.1 hypothetical protein C0W53_21115 [Photobacterium kishitanii]